MKLPIKSIMACGQGLEEYDLTDADGVLIGTVYEWGAAVKIVDAMNRSGEAVERDAERYRWIRTHRNGARIDVWIGSEDGPEQFDAAIDSCTRSEGK
jgi:hypothetical protein